MWYIHTMEYYSAVKKKSEIMPFAAIWMGLEIVILSRKSNTEREISYHFYVKSKICTDELTCKTKTDSQSENRLMWLTKGTWMEEVYTGGFRLADANLWWSRWGMGRGFHCREEGFDL